jgi:hypothetical protein
MTGDSPIPAVDAEIPPPGLRASGMVPQDRPVLSGSRAAR